MIKLKKGFTPQDWDELTVTDEPRVFSLSEESGVEVHLVHDEQTEGSWRMVEVHTANRVYFLDADLVCVEVKDRTTGEGDPRHRLLGSRLMGGQQRRGVGMHIAYPLPVPGMEAVFRLDTGGSGAAYGATSTVEHVVFRVRMTNVDLEEGAEPDWDKVTKRWRAPR